MVVLMVMMIMLMLSWVEDVKTNSKNQQTIKENVHTYVNVLWIHDYMGCNYMIRDLCQNLKEPLVKCFIEISILFSYLTKSRTGIEKKKLNLLKCKT